MNSVMNLLEGTVIAGVAESLALSQKLGLKSDEVLHILEKSRLNCPLVKKLAQGIASCHIC